MKCPKCQTENPEDSRFCRKCGSSTESDISCPNCGSTHPPDSNFCDKCGHDLKEATKTLPVSTSIATRSFPKPPSDKPLPALTKFEAERKRVTALFSDLSGYTAMTEKLDPEEVNQINGRIFNGIKAIVGKYEGFIGTFAVAWISLSPS